MPQIREFTCKGLNYEVTLTPDKMVVRGTAWRKTDSHELPVHRINAVIVRRKSILPYAGFTALAVIATVLTRYNALWFLVNLSAREESVGSTVALIAATVFAIPTVWHAIFVDIAISWEGKPKSFLVRFVPERQGRVLARRFHRASEGI